MHPILIHYLQNRVRNPSDAEDILAATFQKLYVHRQKIHSPEHINRWLYKVVNNASISLLREKIKEQHILYDFCYLTSYTDESDDHLHHLCEKLKTEINRLPPQRKKIIRLYFFERRTTFEIARHMNLSPQTILNHKSKALSDLRRLLSPN